MRLVGLATALAALVVLLAGCGGSSAAKRSSVALLGIEPQGRLAEPSDFELTDQDGKTVRLSAQRGNLVLIAFLYAHCPDVCPLTAESLNQVLGELGPDRSRVRVLAISVDPAGDTPEAVQAFAKAHRLLPEFRYLTGSRAKLVRTWRAFYLGVEPVTGRPFVDHSSYVLLVDGEGRGRARHPGVPTSADVLHDVRALLDSG